MPSLRHPHQLAPTPGQQELHLLHSKLPLLLDLTLSLSLYHQSAPTLFQSTLLLSLHPSSHSIPAHSSLILAQIPVIQSGHKTETNLLGMLHHLRQRSRENILQELMMTVLLAVPGELAVRAVEEVELL
jgi:hypothetical protein